MKFSIRELLFVTGIVALALGWAVDHWRLAEKAAKLENDFIVLTEQIQHLILAKEVETLANSSAPDQNAPKVPTLMFPPGNGFSGTGGP